MEIPHKTEHIMPDTKSVLEASSHIERCPVCGYQEFRPLCTPGNPIGDPIFGPYLHRFGVCRCACGLDFVNPRPSTELLNRFYGSHIYECHKMRQSASADREAQSLLNSIAEHAPYSASKRLLDFGCGGGYFLAHAAKAGWMALGFDVGEAAIETCRNNQLIATNRFQDLEPAGFDVVVLNHVLEHIEEPLGLLQSLGTLLGPLGKLFIVVPNARSARARLSPPILSRKCGFDERYRAFPIHLWYFSPPTITRLLRNAGFEIVLVTTRGMGLEELRRRETLEEFTPREKRTAQQEANGRHPISFLQPAKDAIKRTFYGWGLGENVLVGARLLSESRVRQQRDRG